MKKVFTYFIPFFFFGCTQIALLMLKKKEKQVVPVFVGKNWNDLPEVANLEFFYFAVGGIKSNKAFEHNYILEQYPAPGSSVKKNQKVVLILNENNNSSLEKKNYKKCINTSFLEAESLLKKEGIPYKSISFADEKGPVFYVGLNRQGIVYLYSNYNKKILFIKNNVEKNCNLIENKNVNKICYSKNNEIIMNCSGKIIKKQAPWTNIIKNEKKEKNLFLWHFD